MNNNNNNQTKTILDKIFESEKFSFQVDFKNKAHMLLDDLDKTDIDQLDQDLFYEAMSENTTSSSEKFKIKVLTSSLLKQIYEEFENLSRKSTKGKGLVVNEHGLLDLTGKVSEYALFSEYKILVTGLLYRLKQLYPNETKDTVKIIKISCMNLSLPESMKEILSLLDYFDKVEVLDISYDKFMYNSWDYLQSYLELKFKRKIHIVIFVKKNLLFFIINCFKILLKGKPNGFS